MRKGISSLNKNIIIGIILCLGIITSIVIADLTVSIYPDKDITLTIEQKIALTNKGLDTYDITDTQLNLNNNPITERCLYRTIINQDNSTSKSQIVCLTVLNEKDDIKTIEDKLDNKELEYITNLADSLIRIQNKTLIGTGKVNVK